MRITDLADIISEKCDVEVLLDEPMSKYTSLRIGGPADIFLAPRGVESLQKVIDIARANNVKHHIIGNGTNLLVSDNGVRGIVLQIKSGFHRIMVDEKGEVAQMRAEAGVRLAKVMSTARELGLQGFEFSAGIPGSVGGAIMMNAGTKLGAISDVLISIEILDKAGNVREIKRENLDFSYRQLNLESGAIILSGLFELKYGQKDAVAKKIDDFLEERKKSQPKGRSAGCIFKNPQNGSAGKIIDELGLKGKRIGGAYVSNVHANFIMNDGTATCNDFITLIRDVKEEVSSRTGIKLEYEIKFLGNM